MTPRELRNLMLLPPFRAFIHEQVVVGSGLLSPATNGKDGRDLSFAEGKRDLALSILSELERAMPENRHGGISVGTLIQTLSEASDRASKEQNLVGRSDTDDDRDDSER